MRIVAGSRRGLKLEAPDGQITRPTSERAREALFNILSGTKYRDRLIGQPVADLFAGTGALGIEALSRGAGSCLFVEKDQAALTALKKNLARAKFGDAAKIQSGDALSALESASRLGMVFADPPYQDGVAEATIDAILRYGLLAEEGLIILQAHPKTRIKVSDRLNVLDDRRYGAARFLILSLQSDAPA